MDKKGEIPKSIILIASIIIIILLLVIIALFLWWEPDPSSGKKSLKDALSDFTRPDDSQSSPGKIQTNDAGENIFSYPDDWEYFIEFPGLTITELDPGSDWCNFLDAPQGDCDYRVVSYYSDEPSMADIMAAVEVHPHGFEKKTFLQNLEEHNNLTYQEGDFNGHDYYFVTKQDGVTGLAIVWYHKETVIGLVFINPESDEDPLIEKTLTAYLEKYPSGIKH
ncbi:hypothetical protein GOV14_00200 [Candidatus Pacearchaeota archaeon]|nr:hypothetical protein [Candidatus Pacearchaeota archaeon]